jgi:DNA-binding IclR family transcriptional regulator
MRGNMDVATGLSPIKAIECVRLEAARYTDQIDRSHSSNRQASPPNVASPEIRTIRKRGYAESKGEIFTGGGALAAPLKDFSGKTTLPVNNS